MFFLAYDMYLTNYVPPAQQESVLLVHQSSRLSCLNSRQEFQDLSTDTKDLQMTFAIMDLIQQAIWIHTVKLKILCNPKSKYMVEEKGNIDAKYLLSQLCL